MRSPTDSEASPRGWLGLRLGTKLREYPDRAICTYIRISIAGSPAGENGRALLGKRLGCLPVVLGAAGLHLVRGFHIERPRPSPLLLQPAIMVRHDPVGQQPNQRRGSPKVRFPTH